jgi:hypothetical protein
MLLIGYSRTIICLLGEMLNMNGLKQGLMQAFFGIIGSIILSAILTSSKQNNLIPANYVFLFTLIGFVSSITLLFTFWKAGVGFIAGWIIGAWLLQSVLSTGDFILYIVAPIATLAIRVIVAIKKASGN